ncbi:MAG: 3-deoxy-7-phosphoheptulonate synthase [Deltaproteobacteria bacterium]|nr:3-deoxy-7-phosphoheptulonate synthase [Deltaproteobacteria bacterium]
MIIVLKNDTAKEVIDELLARIEKAGCRPLHLPGTERVVLGALGDERGLAALNLEGYAEVESIKPILVPYKLVSREMHPHDTVVSVAGVPIGGGNFALIGGPCAVESAEQMLASAEAVKAGGAKLLRGGAFKPRTSPYSFQGLGQEGLEILQSVGKQLGMGIITEVIDPVDVDAVAKHADCLQIGARNMQNFRLLEAAGRQDKPVLLKRGMSATIEELLLAAEYIISKGNDNVVLCERGIRTFDKTMRNTLDLSAIPYIKERSHLPIIVDPSHGTGRRELILPMSRAAAACGADGVIVEVHENPSQAKSDGAQSLDPAQFLEFTKRLAPVVQAVGKEIC